MLLFANIVIRPVILGGKASRLISQWTKCKFQTGLQSTIQSARMVSNNSVIQGFQANAGIKSLQITDDQKNVKLEWDNGERANFHSKWLRFNCRCDKCNDFVSRSWVCPPDDIPLQLTIRSISTTDDGQIRIQWNEEEHDGILTTEHLREYSYSDENTRRMRNKVKIPFNTDSTVPQVSWTDVQKSEQMFYKWLRHIGDTGICLLTDVPTVHHYMKNVLSTIGCLTGTLYGEIWDVKVKENVINPAYTPKALLFHMDLGIYEAQPGIQFLHCLKFDANLTGGETLFVDMYHVAEEFRKQYPEEFRILTEVPFTFQRIHYDREDPVHMVLRRPLIYLNDENEIINITFHQHEQGPPLVNEENVEEFYHAYQLFARTINKFPYKKSVRLREGDMICFNNRRLAHGRNAFTGHGERHLQGSYVNSDDFKSKLMYLSNKLDGGMPVSRVGNNDWT